MLYTCSLLFSVARSALRMQETRFQIYLAQQHIEDINYNRFVFLYELLIFVYRRHMSLVNQTHEEEVWL